MMCFAPAEARPVRAFPSRGQHQWTGKAGSAVLRA